MSASLEHNIPTDANSKLSVKAVVPAKIYLVLT